MLKFSFFIILTHKGFDNTDSGNIFLHGIIHCVIFLKNSFEYWIYIHGNSQQYCPKNRKHDYKNHCHADIDVHAHDNRKDQHQRCSDRNSYTHLVGILYIRYVRRHSCNKRRCRKLINIRKRKFLYSKIHILS